MKIKPNLKKSFNIIVIFAVFIWTIQNMGELFICTVFNFFLLLKKILEIAFLVYLFGGTIVWVFFLIFFLQLYYYYMKRFDFRVFSFVCYYFVEKG